MPIAMKAEVEREREDVVTKGHMVHAVDNKVAAKPVRLRGGTHMR